MATYYQLWNDETHNLIDEFDHEADALDEVRWRYTVWGEGAVSHLSLLFYEADKKPVAIALGDELVQYARDIAAAQVAD